MHYILNMSYVITFTSYPIEHTNESGAAKSTESFITDNLSMEHQV